MFSSLLVSPIRPSELVPRFSATVGPMDGEILVSLQPRHAPTAALVARLRDAADQVVHEPANGVVLVLVLQLDLGSEELAELVDPRALGPF